MARVGQVLKWILVTAIAVSLVWIAFVKDNGTQTQADGEEPYISLDSPEITAERTSITNEIETSGTITVLPAEAVKATKSGVVKTVHVKRGERVNSGQQIATISYEVEPAEPQKPAAAVDEQSDEAVGEDGEAAVIAEPKPVVKTVAVTAPIAGKVRNLDIIAEQGVTVGDVIANVVPSKLVYSASLTQEERFRLLTPPAEAEVTIDGGPAPFTCTKVRVEGMEDEDKASSSESDPYSDPYGYGEESAVAVGNILCDVPTDVDAFSGLTASATIVAGSAEGVLTLPVTAVAGSVNSGKVWVYEGNEPQPKDVELGLSDGERVEIRSGLDSDEAVLEFAPGERPENDDEMGWGW